MRSHIQERSDRTCPIKNVGGEQTARPYIQVVYSCLPKKIHEKLCRSQTIV